MPWQTTRPQSSNAMGTTLPSSGGSRRWCLQAVILPFPEGSVRAPTPSPHQGAALFSAHHFPPLLCTEPPAFSSGNQLPAFIEVGMLISIIWSEKEIQCAPPAPELPFLHAGPVSSTYITNSSQLLPQAARLQAGCCFHWIHSIVINCKLSSHKIWSTKKNRKIQSSFVSSAVPDIYPLSDCGPREKANTEYRELIFLIPATWQFLIIRPKWQKFKDTVQKCILDVPSHHSGDFW